MSDAAFPYKYSAYIRRVQDVYLPVTLTVENRPAHVVVRVDCASTSCVLEQPSRGLPLQYFKAISACKARLVGPVIVEAAKRTSAI